MSLASQTQQDARSAKSLNQIKTYVVDLTSLNNSGVMGTATQTLNGDMLTVHITASGLEPNKLHPQHIHGFVENNQNAVCPPMSADKNGDGLIELGEGLPYYGNVLIPLVMDFSNLLFFPTADASGNIDYTQTIDLTKDNNGDGVADLVVLPLQNDAIVLHGLTVDGSYMRTLPVACGEIRPYNGK
ncbi:hypothetical protein [Pontibacter chitinilyticus]|uniref:hypothetical protein n=1 Tax=Pontibacter chitinilyticus TaxID=2674989 RepID=UPI00321AAB2E